MENKLTTTQALTVIGFGLAHESLKLSQKEHLGIVESFKLVESELSTLEEIKNSNIILEKKILELEEQIKTLSAPE